MQANIASSHLVASHLLALHCINLSSHAKPPNKNIYKGRRPERIGPGEKKRDPKKKKIKLLASAPHFSRAQGRLPHLPSPTNPHALAILGWRLEIPEAPRIIQQKEQKKCPKRVKRGLSGSVKRGARWAMEDERRERAFRDLGHGHMYSRYCIHAYLLFVHEVSLRWSQ